MRPTIKILEEELIMISGRSWDNLGVEKVEVALDNGEFIQANGTENWFIEWDIGELGLGDHTISARVFDMTGRESECKIAIVVNESGHDWSPQINTFYHKPDNLTNISNVVVYANITSESPFGIKSVILYWYDGNMTKNAEMYKYGINPVQGRHEEDPLNNESNNPIFGFELGQFSTNTTVTYWVVAYDTANNSIKSSERSFAIE